MERGRIQGLPNFFEYPLLSQEQVKLRSEDSQNFSGHPYIGRAHRTIFFAIAQLSCFVIVFTARCTSASRASRY